MSYYMTDANGKIIAFSDKNWEPKNHNILYTEKDIVLAWDGEYHFADEIPIRPKTEVLAELKTSTEKAIQLRLDEFARTRTYDCILSACTYNGSTNEIYRAEAEYCVALRDETWTKAYEIMNDVLAGKRPIPTIDEVFNELPRMAWPVERPPA